MSDLRQRVPGHSLIDELLHQWDLGNIRLTDDGRSVVIDEEAEGWYRGVVGEREVADLLAELNDEYMVLHSVPVGKGASDIDHVVVGPSGVFTINTKYSPDKPVWVAGVGLFVGGSKQSYIRNSLFEARRASKLLSQKTGMTVPVTGVIVFVDPSNITVKAPPGGTALDDPDIFVVRDSELLAIIDGRQVFSDEQVAAIAAKAVEASTWSYSPTTSTRGSHITGEFLALEQAVGPHFALPRARSRAQPSRRNSSSRPSGSRQSRGNRKPRKSRLEVLVAELTLPIAGLIGVWVWLQSQR